MTRDYSKAGEILRVARVRAGLSRSDLAAHAKCFTDTVHMVEEGQFAPSRPLAGRIMSVLSLTGFERSVCMSCWGMVEGLVTR